MTQTNEPNHVDDIGKQILDGVKAHLGDAWASFTTEDQQLIADVATDAATLSLQSMTALSDGESADRLLAEKRQINAQLANIAVLKATNVQAALWNTVAYVLGKGVSVALAAVMA